jgi:phytanoyl-CoA hydroxylase
MPNKADQFNAQGYLVLEDFVPHQACDALMLWAETLAEGFDYKGQASVFQTSEQSKSTDDYFLDSGDKISFFFEKDAFDEKGELKNDLFHSLNKIGHALHDLDPVFDSFSRSEEMRQLSNELLLQDHLLIQSMMIFKHAKIGGKVDVHQDASFLYTEPQSCVGFWFALEDATIENGCLWAKPGGHQTSLRSWFKRKEGGGTEMKMLDDTLYDLEGMQALEVPKGSCIVLHGLLPHYSLPNTSGKSRQAYAIHTIDKNAVYPAENWLSRTKESLRGFGN